jgi:hypothetical protein
VALVIDLPPGGFSSRAATAPTTVSLGPVPVAADALTFVRATLTP